ncbi:hypothetical protein [Shinella sp.]|uniref:hypothetical protein n=1 Tax=Shinella sp. TaxID=1870904 RepID=UPI004035C6D3
MLSLLTRKLCICMSAAFLFALNHALADDRQQLFVCGSGPAAAPTNMFELTGVLLPSGEWTALQFAGFGEGMPPMHFPLDPGPGRNNFFFSNSDGPEGYLVEVRFRSGQNAYRLYSLYTPPKSSDDGAGGGEAGLEITGPDATPRKLTCDERPYMFIAYMRDAMSCDFSNPFGAAGCDDDTVPQRTASDPLR